MSQDRLRGIIAEAEEFRILFIMIARGTLLVCQEFLDINKDFPEITFLVFINSLLLNEGVVAKLKR